jgi:hypothetical protein
MPTTALACSGASVRADTARSRACGTVSTELVREAPKETLKIADLLVVCGFALEALVGEEASHLDRLTIIKAKINLDLQMPDQLKKTVAGNLFMVFGEPNIDIRAGVDDNVHGRDSWPGRVRPHYRRYPQPLNG